MALIFLERESNIVNRTARLVQSFKKFPFGLWLFSRLLCFKAPYFSSIRPTFILVEPGKVEAVVKKRRSVTNHLGTIHAIAMANLCELVAGTALEVTLPNSHRWIPKSMKIKYIAKATSDIRGTASISLDTIPDNGSRFVTADVYDSYQTLVVKAEIEMHISKTVLNRR